MSGLTVLTKITKFGKNYYGGLILKKEEGEYYALIENHSTDMGDDSEWERIPESLYSELMLFENAFDHTPIKTNA